MAPVLPHLPRRPSDRLAVYRLFNGISEEGKEGIDAGRTRMPLVKTFLIEHVSEQNGRTPKPPFAIWERLGAEPSMIDEHFLSLQGHVRDSDGNEEPRTVGYLEQFDRRFFAYYTVEGSQQARHRVEMWIQGSPDLDHTWFSSPLLQALWKKDVSLRGDDRFVKLDFRHESVFDLPDDSSEAEEPTEDQSDEVELHTEEDGPEPERRRSRFLMGDRIGKIRAALTDLQRDYNPLNSLSGLRLPSLHRRGSHDLYQNGQLTNRSDSFEDHRNTARYLHQIYGDVLKATEKQAWRDLQRSADRSHGRVAHKGVPLIIRFEEMLAPSTFDCWMRRAFTKRNVFRLWGEPIRLGKTKVHVYGADRHLWQPLNLEITESRVVAILPQGTCGNTFHRLVTNIQRYVCPKITAWLGSSEFGDLFANVGCPGRDDAE